MRSTSRRRGCGGGRLMPVLVAVPVSMLLFLVKRGRRRHRGCIVLKSAHRADDSKGYTRHRLHDEYTLSTTGTPKSA